MQGGEWDDAQFNLHRIYGYCQNATAEDCEAAKREFVEKVSKKPAKLTSGSLRLIVRDQQYLDYLKSIKSDDPQKYEFAVYEQIGDDLYALLASDSPDQIAVVGDRGLKELGLTREQAWSIAYKQTLAILPKIPVPDQLKKSAVAYQDQEYLGSLLVDRAAWSKLAEKVGSELFVTVVSDSFVFAGWMPDGPDLEKFKQTVRDDCATQQRCISPNVYRFRHGRWAVSQ